MTLEDLLPPGTLDELEAQVPKPGPGKTTLARCPQCGAVIEPAPSNPFRPFCSRRCRLLDLQAWLSGSRGLPVRAEQS